MLKLCPTATPITVQRVVEEQLNQQFSHVKIKGISFLLLCSGFLQRYRAKAREEYAANTLGGLVTFAQAHYSPYCTLGEDFNQVHCLTAPSQVVSLSTNITQISPSPDRMLICLTTPNMLRNAINQAKLRSSVALADATYRLTWNSLNLMVCFYLLNFRRL